MLANLRARVIRGIVDVLIPDPRILIDEIQSRAVYQLSDKIDISGVKEDLNEALMDMIEKDDVLQYIVDNSIDVEHIERRVIKSVVDGIDNDTIIETVVESVERKMSDTTEIEDRIIDRLVDEVSVDEDDVINRILLDLDIDAKVNALLRDKVADTLRRIAGEVGA
jgi:hypothetical protein